MPSFSQREAFLQVEIEGVDDFRRALARADKRLRRRFDRLIRSFGSEVRDDARARYAASRFGGGTGRTAKGLTSSASFGVARLNVNRSGARPWLLGQEWGSNRFKQFGPPRGGPLGSGTFYWPAYTEGIAGVEEATLEAIEDAVGVLTGRRRL